MTDGYLLFTRLPGGTNFFWLPSPNRINLEEPLRVASPTRINLEEPIRVASPTRINLEEPVRVASPTRINSFLCLSFCLSVRAKRVE